MTKINKQKKQTENDKNKQKKKQIENDKKKKKKKKLQKNVDKYYLFVKKIWF